MKTIYTLLLILIAVKITGGMAWAQEETKKISGIVINSEDEKVVPYAHIVLKGYALGTSSNQEGEFELKLPVGFFNDHNSLKVSCIGFQNQEIGLDEIDGRPLTIILEPALVKLNEVVVGSRKSKFLTNKARKILEKAFKQIHKNYPRKEYLLNTFYRHYCSENEVYGRLIEAAVDIYDPKGNKRYYELPTDKVELKVNHLRRSFDYTSKARYRHSPISLNYVLSHDLTSYTYKNPLTEDLGIFQLYLADTTFYDNDLVYVIEFDQQSGFHSPYGKTYRGQIFVNSDDFAILRVESHSKFIRNNPLDTSYTVIDKTLSYQHFEDKYYIRHIISEGRASFKKYDTLGRLEDDWNHQAHVELITNNIHKDPVIPFEGKEPGRRELMAIHYDSSFWDNYTVLKATPLEEKIEKDLASRAPLQQQFETFNIIASGGSFLLEDPEFKHIIEQNQGHVQYIVVWASWGYPNFFEIQPIKYFSTKLRNNKIKYLFISLDQDEEQWLQSRKFNQLNIPKSQHLQMPFKFNDVIARQYFNNFFPIYLLVDKKGEVFDKQAKMPSNSELKADLKKILNRKYYQDK
ncbi:MAG: carboxypeptidase-like regulatory domain-containing protein [Bacteroidetes bacterium]|nr:carboxypeptidase-like regulatory domain-containing protein [Bacteroidota bacterium]